MSDPRNPLPENTLQITLYIEGDTLRIASGYNFSEDLDDEMAAYFAALMDGVVLLMEADPATLLKAAEIGYTYDNMRKAIREQEEQEKLDALPDVGNLIKMKIKGGLQ